MIERSTLRTTVVALAVAALTVTATVAVVASVTTAAAAPIGLAAAAVEDEGTDCAVSLPSSLPANSRLPDPFRRLDGTRITTRSDWRCRSSRAVRARPSSAASRARAAPSR